MNGFCPTCGRGGYWPDPINAAEFPEYDLVNHRWIPQSEWTPEIIEAVTRRQKAMLDIQRAGRESNPLALDERQT